MRENVLISEDKELLNLSLIHDFLSNESAWAKGISLQTVKTSVENSLCIGAYINNVQVGFCRVITDYATFANLVDVIVWPKYRGQAISKLIMKSVIEHHKLVGIRRFTLATTDAHGLYKQFGFNALNKPETFME